MKDGGPAFPVATEGPDGDGGRYPTVLSGMTRRQWLAGLAMQGLIACSDAGLDWPNCSMVAKQAYKQADAMLAYEESEQCSPKP